VIQVWQEATSSLLLLGGLLGSLGDLATLLSLLDGLDDTNSNGLPHITDGEPTERGVLVIALDTHGLAGDELGNASVTRLDELGRLFKNFSTSPVDLLNQLGEFAGNVGGMTIQDGGVTRANLTGVVEDDNLGIEGSSLLGGIVFRVRGNVSTTDILNRDVLDVETDVVTRLAGLELLVVHFDRLDFSSNVAWGEGNDHAGLDDTSLDTTDGHRSDTTDLVHILKRRRRGLSEGRVGGSMASMASKRVLPLTAPDFVSLVQPLYHVMLGDSSNMLSPCHPEMGTKATALGL
jgi:hypothetical protein